MPKSKAQKKKDREKESREKILRRRTAIRLHSKKEDEEARSQKEAQRIANIAEGKTIISRDAIDQHNLIQKNLDILKALEEEQIKLEENKPAGKTKASADVVFTPKES